jgi:hypothetical protein
MITWYDLPLETSERVCAEAYDAKNRRIIVRFRRDGTEYWYGDCTAGTWQDFTTPGQSRGKYIHRHLDPNPNRGYWDSARNAPQAG